MKNVHVFVPVFLYAVTMLIFQIKRIISSEKWCNCCGSILCSVQIFFSVDKDKIEPQHNYPKFGSVGRR